MMKYTVFGLVDVDSCCFKPQRRLVHEVTICASHHIDLTQILYRISLLWELLTLEAAFLKIFLLWILVHSNVQNNNVNFSRFTTSVYSSRFCRLMLDILFLSNVFIGLSCNRQLGLGLLVRVLNVIQNASRCNE